MKEYKILTADNPQHAEQVMNDMAQAGWRVVGTTTWELPFQIDFVITLERECPNS